MKRHVTVSRVREALKESEEKLRSVTELALDAIVTADAEEGAADVYSVGVLVDEMITGRAPFAAEANPWTTLWRQMHTKLTPLHELDPAVPEPLSDLTLRDLSHGPGDRPDAGELETGLRQLLAELPLGDDPPLTTAAAGDRAPGDLTLGDSLALDWYADAEGSETLDRGLPGVAPEAPTEARPRPDDPGTDARPPRGDGTRTTGRKGRG